MYIKPLLIHPESRKIYVLESLDKDGEISQQLTEFADLIQAPEQVHTYMMTPYSLWTAKAKGKEAHEIISFLENHSQNEIPDSFKLTIQKDVDHFGALEFLMEGDDLLLSANTPELIKEIISIEGIRSKIIGEPKTTSLLFKLRYRKEIKKLLFEQDYFVKDATYEFDEEIDITLKERELTDYQMEAVEAYLKYNGKAGGGGTIIMPPNSGKILVGLKIMEVLKTSTLIIVEDKYKLDKWKQEILSKTDIQEETIAVIDEFDGNIKPIMLGTFRSVSECYEKLSRFGFVIFDDAHRLPTPTHEITLEIKSQNKLALASTLARSDGKGYLVLALVGPKWYEILHRTLIHKNHQVPVHCIEVKIPLPDDERKDYERRDQNKKINEDSRNSNKEKVVEVLLQKEKTKRILLVSFFDEIVSNYVRMLGLNVLKSSLNEESRQAVIKDFNNKKIDKIITASKLIENIPLKTVDVMIALSHQQGSEREEYLRIGKLIPATDGKKGAYLYSLVSRNTDEERFYVSRRKEMINYGFVYKIRTFEEIMERGEFFES